MSAGRILKIEWAEPFAAGEERQIMDFEQELVDIMTKYRSTFDAAVPDYVGNPAIPYSTTTWDDPNHSYRSWGNDGTSFNVSLTIAGNQMVGETIAQALVDSALGGGHRFGLRCVHLLDATSYVHVSPFCP